MENGQRQIDTDLLTREVRLTLGQLPARLTGNRYQNQGLRTDRVDTTVGQRNCGDSGRMGLSVELRPVAQMDGAAALASIPEAASPALSDRTSESRK